MFSYYLELGLRSLKRNKVLTALMVMTIGFGVAATMTTWSVFRAVSGDPIPWKSDKLFVPQVGDWETNDVDDTEPPHAVSFPDAMGLMQAHRARYQSAMYQIAPSVVPREAGLHPFNVVGHAVYTEFFPMVDAPFAYGGAWTAEADQRRAEVVVISADLNAKLFDGGNSVGKSVQIDDRQYRVVGVLAEWNPQPRFYDVVNSGTFRSESEDLFVPLQTAIAAGIPNTGNTDCNSPPEQSGFDGLQASECVWLAFLVQLDDAGAVEGYRRFLAAYASGKRQAGGFVRAPDAVLRSLPQFLDHLGVVPRDTVISLLVALGLLLVCLVNTAGLLLAKFLRRAGEIGVRRALGASRREIHIQYLIEAVMVGVAGGALGLLLTGMGVVGISWVLPEEIAEIAQLDVPLLALTLVVSVAATALAGIYPTVRAAQVQPAWQLKSN